ncbi:MAG: LysR family transcriptional regulator [Pseudoruegeria sp.]
MNTRITLKQLETLYWIVELGTFEKAASQLFATQSAVSKRMQELERGVGIEIFNRYHRGAKLTSKGEELYDIAKKMLLLHDQILEMRSTECLHHRSLKIGVTDLVTTTWFSQFVTETRDRFPQVRLEPKVAMDSELLNDLEQDKLDLIIIPETPTLPEYTSVPIESVPNHWIAKTGYFNLKAPIRHRDFSDFTVLVQGQLSGSSVYLNKWLKNRGVTFPDTLVCDSMSALLGLTVAGLGVTYLPFPLCRQLVENGILEIIQTEVPLPPVPYVAIYRQDRPLSLVQEIADIAVSSSDFTRHFPAVF